MLSKLLAAGSVLGRFCPFLWRVAVTTASTLVEALDAVVIDGLVIGLLLGHGERPRRVLGFAVLVLVVTSLLYWQVGTFVLDPDTDPITVGHPSWWNALYYSLVSFAALGYGGWAPIPLGWARWLGAVESFLGIFSAVFFSVTLGQRITR